MVSTWNLKGSGKKKHTLKRKQVILKSTTQLLGHLLVEGRIWPAANCATACVNLTAVNQVDFTCCWFQLRFGGASTQNLAGPSMYDEKAMQFWAAAFGQSFALVLRSWSIQVRCMSLGYPFTQMEQCLVRMRARQIRCKGLGRSSSGPAVGAVGHLLFPLPVMKGLVKRVGSLRDHIGMEGGFGRHNAGFGATTWLMLFRSM